MQRRLGGGTLFEVYLAFDERRLTPIAVKVVRPHLVNDSVTLSELSREVNLVGRMAHSNIVRGLHADISGPRPYLAMERVNGPSLSSLIRKFGRLSLDQLVPLGMELAAAVHYLHELQIVHLDIKPSNVMMDVVPKLIDLSAAREILEARKLTQTTGTNQYLAPEQVNPPTYGELSLATDVWGLGVTLFHALAGYRAFESSTEQNASNEVNYPQLKEAPQPMPASTPTPLVELVTSCLAKDPTHRPAPVEIFNALDAVASGKIGRNARFRLFRLTSARK